VTSSRKRLNKRTRRRSPYSLKVAPPAEGSQPKTHKEQWQEADEYLAAGDMLEAYGLFCFASGKLYDNHAHWKERFRWQIPRNSRTRCNTDRRHGDEPVELARCRHRAWRRAASSPAMQQLQQGTLVDRELLQRLAPVSRRVKSLRELAGVARQASGCGCVMGYSCPRCLEDVASFSTVGRYGPTARAGVLRLDAHD